MAKLDLTQYGITGSTVIAHNPSYEKLFEEETKAGLEGFEVGQNTELGAIGYAQQGLNSYCIIIAGMAGVLIPYLYFNLFGKAEKNRKIFMGDSGSLTLGFVLGFLAVKFSMNSTGVMAYRSDGLLLAYTLLIVPCFDVVRVILVRLRVGQPLFKADKRHIHHKLLRMGLSQHRALVVILSLQLLFVLLNTMMSGAVDITIIVLIDIAMFMAFHFAVNVAIKKHECKAE